MKQLGFEESLSRVTREISSLARSGNPEAVSWRDLRSSIVAAATPLRLEAGEASAPVRPDRIAPMRRITEIGVFEGRGSTEAALIPFAHGFRLRLRAGRPAVRHRFSVAHEIGHTFFYNLAMSPPRRLLACGAKGRLTTKEEEICSAFARALLMPDNLTIGELKRCRDCNRLEVLESLSRSFAVSEEVAVTRLLWDLSELPECVVILSRKSRPEAEGRRVGGDGLRRWWGQAVKGAGLRKRESKAVESITLNIDRPAVLREIAAEFEDVIVLDFKTKSMQGVHRSIAVVTVNRLKPIS